jgi:hypothetical protein
MHTSQLQGQSAGHGHELVGDLVRAGVGMDLKLDPERGGYIISRIREGSPASESGDLQVIFRITYTPKNASCLFYHPDHSNDQDRNHATKDPEQKSPL